MTGLIDFLARFAGLPALLIGGIVEPNSSTTVATLQSIGFATGTALCWLLGVLQWKSDRRTGNTMLYTCLWPVGSIWTLGSFTRQLLLLTGHPAISRSLVMADVIAWSSTCLGPALILRVVDYEIPNKSVFRRILLGLSTLNAAALMILLYASAFQPGFPLTTGLVRLLTFYSAIGHGIACGLIAWARRRREQSAGRPMGALHWLIRATVVLGLIEFVAIAISAFAPARFNGLRITAMVTGQQWVIPWSVLMAGFMAESRYADVVLKRSLTVLSIVVGSTLAVWWIPGIVPGLPVVLMSLLVASLILAAPSFHRLLNWTVDRVLLRRPEYQALARGFADASRRTANQDELFALAERCVQAALRLGASLHAAADAGLKRNAVIERMPVGRGHVLELTPTTEGRTLMQEELIFLHAIGTEVSRRLEALEFERERRELQVREERLQHSLTQAELKALRAQVDPHFLFNTLNTITDLISTDPQKAETMTELLAEFFRYTLSHPDRTLSTLDQEFDFVRHYLGIEQVRFGERLHVELSRDPELGREMVPSLILQPLVENAVRHGLAPKLKGGSISVSATCEGKFLQIQVADDGVGMRTGNGRGTGIGLQNVRDRLRALYGDSAHMDIDTGTRGSGTCVKLILPKHVH